MTAARPAAPRNLHRAAALFLAHDTDFPTRWRRDSTLQTWRFLHPESGHWRPLLGDLAPLAHEVTERLEAALSSDLPPFVFRAVGAPVEDTKIRREAFAVSEWKPGDHDLTDTIHGDYLDPVLTADDLAASTSWDDARDRLATKYVARFRRRARDGAHQDYERGMAAPLIGPRQRDTLLKAASAPDTAPKVLVALSGMPECAYAAPPAPVEVDARAWLEEHLHPAPGVDTPMGLVHRHYVAAVETSAPGVKPLEIKRLRRLLADGLGAEFGRTKTANVVKNLALVDDQGRLVTPTTSDPAAPLRLVASDTA